MLEKSKPEKLPDDYDNNMTMDYKGVRIANINAASAACSELIAVRACAGTDAATAMGKYDVCIEGEKQHFGLAGPVNKYPPGGVHNTPDIQPDGIFVFADGGCQYAFHSMCTYALMQARMMRIQAHEICQFVHMSRVTSPPGTVGAFP